MSFEALLESVGPQPFVDVAELRRRGTAPTPRQLSRWRAAGRLIRLRRSLYLLPSRYRPVRPHRFAIAARLARPSVVSLGSALAHHGLVAEPPFVTSVTTGRPRSLDTPEGRFAYRHLTPRLFGGANEVQLDSGERVRVTGPEKALVDLFWLMRDARGESVAAKLAEGAAARLSPETLLLLARATGAERVRRAADALLAALMVDAGM